MPPSDVLKKIVTHQLTLTRQVRQELKDHLTDELTAAFVENEAFLAQLQTQEEILSPDVERLQNLWENLSQLITQHQQTLQEAAQMTHKKDLLSRMQCQ
jgi:hypothetical protein